MSCAITKDSYVIRILLSEVIFLTWLLSLQNITPNAISYNIFHGEKIRNWKRKPHFRFSKQSKWATFLLLFFTPLSNINKISHEENIQNWKRKSHFRFRNKVSEHLFVCYSSPVLCSMSSVIPIVIVGSSVISQ